MKWYNKIFILLVFIGLSNLVAVDPEQWKTVKPTLKWEILTFEKGFGYQISDTDRILIRQEFIPAVQNKNHFLTATDAELIAELVVQKLSNDKNPIVTLKEIKNLRIQIE